MIYEGSCDAEYWNNDCANFDLSSKEKNIFKFHNIKVFTIFDQINAYLVKINVFFQKQTT